MRDTIDFMPPLPPGLAIINCVLYAEDNWRLNWNIIGSRRWWPNNKVSLNGEFHRHGFQDVKLWYEIDVSLNA
jgi:hypothetical protein